MNHRSKLLLLKSELSARSIARDEEIEALLVGALARQNVALIGPPGTGKSALVENFAIGVGLRPYFRALLSRFTTPEQLFGPYKLTALQQDRFTRASEGYLPSAKVAFLDEAFKAGPAILNSLLTMLNERVFFDDGEAKKTALRLVVAASNELPEGEALEALWDRFGLRLFVSPLTSTLDQAKLEELETRHARGELTEMSQVIEEANLDAASVEVRRVEIPESTLSAKSELRRALMKEGVTVSDRRWFACNMLIRAVAYLDGENTAARRHLWILRHALWNAPEQREAVTRIVGEIAAPEVAQAREIADAALVATHDYLELATLSSIPELQDRWLMIDRALKKCAAIKKDADAAVECDLDAIVDELRSRKTEIGEHMVALTRPLGGGHHE